MTGGRRSPSGDQAVALGRAARRITDRDRWLLRMLHEHTVLTTPQITRLRFAGSARSVQVRLRDLRRWGVIEKFAPMTSRGSAPGHHVLGPLGARVLAAEIGVEVAALGWRRDRALGVAHRLSLAHDVAMTDLVVELVTAPGLHVGTWWSPTRCRRELGHHVRPDAYIAAAVEPTVSGPTGGGPTGGGPGGRDPVAVPAWRVWEMACEYDTGSTTLGFLAAKLRGYYELAAAAGVTVPVAVWVARAGREPGARRALAAAHQALPDPRRVPVLTGTRPPEHTTDTGPGGWCGAAGRVWSPLQPGGEPGRVRLADLAVPARATLAEILHESTGAADQHGGPHDVLPRGLSDGLPDWRGGRVELPAPSPYPPPVVLPPPAQARARRAPGGRSS